MTLEHYLAALDETRQRAAALRLCGLALPIWEAYAEEEKHLQYVDSVVGMFHKVAPDVLARIEAAVALGGEANFQALSDEMLDPIVSLQDGDWELTEPVLLCFYAHHNLLEHMLGNLRTVHGTSSLYVSVNQAADALEKSGRMSFSQLWGELEVFAAGRAPEDGTS